MQELLLFRAKHQLRFAGMGGQLLNSAPDALQRYAQPVSAVLEPTGEIAVLLPHFCQSGIIARPVFPIKFVDRKNVVIVEAAQITATAGGDSKN